jgi:hypothetical protein
VSYADHTSDAFVPGSVEGKINSVGTTTVLTGIPAATYRQIKGITIRNTHAADPCTVVVKVAVGATDYLVSSPILLEAFESVIWEENVGWVVYTAVGLIHTGAVVGTIAWGDITGSLINQTDLKSELDTLQGLIIAL